MNETQVAIRSVADVEALWRRLMGRGGFGLRTLWIVFLDEDSVTRDVIVPIEDIPQRPDAQLLGNLGRILADLDACAVLLLLSRPGAGVMTEDDREWARQLRAVLGPDVCPWPVHLATRDQVQVFAPDDLIASA